ncbi:MAG: NUDIX domain-containing protein [Clostridiales bacterium]|nr:NUDIX domain-containing protein [Clostridiales bacterium]
MKDISVMIDGVKFNFRVGVIFENKGRVLLERGYNIDFSVIPGGRVQTLETVKQALIREIHEELEIDISKEKIDFISIIENFFTMDETKYHELYYVFRIKLDDDNIIAQKNNFINKDSGKSTYTWIDIDKLDNIKILPVQLKDLIKSNHFQTIVVDEIN